MLRAYLIAAIVFILSACAAPQADAFPPHSVGGALPPAACPYAAYMNALGTPDPCNELLAAGHLTGSFQYTSEAALLADFQQSGQTYAGQLLTQVPYGYHANFHWDEGGYDFPIADYTPRALMLDVRTNHPATCSYAAPPLLNCGGAAALNIQNYNFHVPGGPCVILYLNNAQSGDVVVDDNSYQRDTQCLANTHNFIGIAPGVTGKVTISSNSFDGNCPALTSAGSVTNTFPAAEIGDGRSVSTQNGVLKFNAFFHSCGRPSNLNGPQWKKYSNFYDNWCQVCSNLTTDTRAGYPNGSGIHGETAQFGNLASSVHVLLDSEFETSVVGQTPYECCTSGMDQLDGIESDTLTSYISSNNTIITNTVIGGGPNVGNAIVAVSFNHVGTVTVQNDLVDLTGATLNGSQYECVVDATSTRGLQGTIAAGSLNLLTITGATAGWPNSGQVTVGSVITGGAPNSSVAGSLQIQFPYATIASLGTGTGQTGTYNLSNSISQTSTGNGSFPFNFTSVVDNWVFGNSVLPANGGSANVSLTNGSIITGYTRIDNPAQTPALACSK